MTLSSLADSESYLANQDIFIFRITLIAGLSGMEAARPPVFLGSPFVFALLYDSGGFTCTRPFMVQ